MCGVGTPPLPAETTHRFLLPGFGFHIRYYIRMSRYRIYPAPEQDVRQADLAQGGTERRIPRYRQARVPVGSAAAEPALGRDPGAEGGLGPVPLVPPRPSEDEVVPGHPRPGRPLACRVRPRSRPYPGASLVREFDVVRIEDLNIRAMTQSAKGTVEAPGRGVAAKAGLNREIRRSGWGLLGRRLEEKAPGRVEKVNPAFTSQRCARAGTWTGSRARASRAGGDCAGRTPECRPCEPRTPTAAPIA